MMEINHQENNFTSIPIVDIGSYMDGSEAKSVAEDIRNICKSSGFFYIKNHGVSEQLQQTIRDQAKVFFALPKEEKYKIHMKLGGSAWRGYFELGEEFTSGKIDLKQGLYLGQQLSEQHPLVLQKTPLHGRNLFPSQVPGFKETILQWMSEMERVGEVLIQAIAESLNLDKHYFKANLCKETLGLFRIFHYPIDNKKDKGLWGVGQHTDYGLLTILMITDQGLEVKNRSNQWVKADPIENTFIINIGDMLERITKGLYRSTPHRARNVSETGRYSFPFFYEPGWNSEVKELDIQMDENQRNFVIKNSLVERWDNLKLSKVSGTYGEYLTSKVKKVFPELAEQNLKTQ